MEAADSVSLSGTANKHQPEEQPDCREDEIQFVSEGVSRPVLDCIDLVSSDEESSGSQVVRKVKPKDYIDLQRDRVASTLDRLQRQVEVERREKEARNKDFLERKDSLHARGLQELEFIKGNEGTEEARRCVEHWLKMPGVKPGSVNSSRRPLPTGPQTSMNNRPITCPVINCNRKFDNGHLLLGHLKRFDHSPCDPAITLHGTPIPSYACMVCFRRFTTQEQYKDHLLIKNEKTDRYNDEHSKNPQPQVIQCFACPNCFLLFNLRDECLQHMSAKNHFTHRFKLSDVRGIAVPIPFPSYAKKILISMCKDVPFQVQCTSCHHILRTDIEVTAHFKTRCRSADPAAVSEKSIWKVAELFLLKGYCLSCKLLFSSNEQVNQHKESTRHNARLVSTMQESVLVFCYINEKVQNPSDFHVTMGRSNLKSSMLKRAFGQLGSKGELVKGHKDEKGKHQAIAVLKQENKVAVKTAWFCECNQKFQTDEAAEKHILSANRICYKCMVCGKKAGESAIIHLHMSRIHGGAHLKNYLFWCNACSIDVPRKESAMAHVAECHSGHTYYYDHEVQEEEPSPSTSKEVEQASLDPQLSASVPSPLGSAGGKWECSICEELFDSEESVQQHCRSLGTHQFHKVCCDICKMRFHRVERLYRHCQDQHSGEVKVKYVCGLCEELYFVVELDFLNHYTVVHSKEYVFLPDQTEVSIKQEEATPSTSQDNNARLTCGCLPVYLNKSHKKEDLITCKENLLVRGSVWYGCNICKATAQKEADILEHYSSEHNKKTSRAPFFVKCGTCSKMFSDLDCAQQHYHSSHSFLQKPNLTHPFGSTEVPNGIFQFTASGSCVTKQHTNKGPSPPKGVNNRLRPSERPTATESVSLPTNIGEELELSSIDTGGKTNWKPPENCPIFNYLEKIGTFFLHPRCSDRKDAADFAICMHAGRMDEQLPKHIPFTILSGDKGFLELENQFDKTQRPAHILNPHHIDGEMMCALLNSISETTKESVDDGEDDCNFKLTMELSLKDLQMPKDEKELGEAAEIEEAIRRSLAEAEQFEQFCLNEG
ncbi:E3 SUMO-protein ligase ZNF451 isoform X2 [Ambystoma mexicanum]|uniref:E3 SUMO-protein ligase ZNF451 isoform X2 n=1 Tax=Ambystoma mexicanum TaxID=8296 RepID=UPI0037E76836